VEDGSTSSNESGNIYYKHESDSTTRFRHPIPMNHTEFPSYMANNTSPYLSCETNRAVLRIASFRNPPTTRSMRECAFVKASVFELPQFTRGPEKDAICQTICLEDTYGVSAGVLRRMDNTELESGKEVELIAISSGSVSFEDLKSASEERADRTGTWRYPSSDKVFWRALPGNDSGFTLDDYKGNASVPYHHRYTAQEQFN
jgi:hypothetical protein